MAGDPFGAGWRGPTLCGKNGRPGATGPDLRGDEYSSPSFPFGLTDSWDSVRADLANDAFERKIFFKVSWYVSHLPL
jgi:hypothetical protein